ncbi:MAG: DUF2250 domain-containing protein [candidate division Zixibacteria bacterium]|nr:DUF2250 domain-containing protein [candidate division Zixibacteria bacterium]
MIDMPPLKADYRLAKCCKPVVDDEIVGFLKIDSPIISVHRADCINLAKVAKERLVTLTWNEIIEENSKPDLLLNPEYTALDDIDFKVLNHHQVMGNDYAAVTAQMTRIPRATVFERYKKLRDLKLLKRVQPVMIRYRKNIVNNKWIKHRNHTYYEITPKGSEFLEHYEDNE